MGAPECPRERILALGHGDEVYVVAHQAITQNPGAVTRGVAAQQFQVTTVVFGRKEDARAIVAALSDVVRQTGNHHARSARHTKNMAETPACSQENASVPFLTLGYNRHNLGTTFTLARVLPALLGAFFYPRLDSAPDREAFRGWFTFLAEAQFYRPAGELPPEIGDCAALIRFAYRESLREHDGAWAGEVGLSVAPPFPSVRQFQYPRWPWGANLFSTGGGSLRAFADAETLWRHNTHLVSRRMAAARPGDLLFFRHLDQNMPFHAMVYVGQSHFEPARQSYVVYHTGPLGNGKGEMRHPTVAELLLHPQPRWRPLEGNSNFLGVYRWNILRDSD
jgi:uncharacterized protein YfaT (DUF1175 family)